MAVEIMRRELSAAALRQAAARSRDANAARRMLAIALVLDGHSREDAAASCGMDRQTLRDWVHRYNAEGLAGLSNRRAPGPTPRLSDGQEAELARWVEKGTDPERDGEAVDGPVQRVEGDSLVGARTSSQDDGAVVGRMFGGGLGERRLAGSRRSRYHDGAERAAPRRVNMRREGRAQRVAPGEHRPRASTGGRRSGCAGAEHAVQLLE